MPIPRTVRLLLAAALACPVGLAVDAARGQVAHLVETTIPVLAASGPVANDDPFSDSARVVYEQDVAVPGNGIARLVFGEAALSGSVAAGTGSFITITSALDGASQRLNAEHLQQWGGKSAYFNGPILTVRLHAFPGTGISRLSIVEAIVEDASPTPPFEPRTICGTLDDRVPSTDNRQGRFAGGCTAWIINDTNSSLLTAGHCGASASSVMSFIVPLSTSTGGLVASHPDNQYAVDIASNQGLSGGTGNDWRNIAVFPNSNHGQTPFQRYGVRHVLAPAAPAAAGITLRITGYGTNAAPMPATLNQTQQTHAAVSLALSGTRVRYTVDTTGGNSGSCVLDETTGLAIGIHTHGGCSATGGSNTGTAVQLAGLQGALAAPLGVCASGNGTVAGTWFALGDRANNFGSVNAAPQKFAKIAQIGAEWQGLAFNPTLGETGGFYAVNESRQLFTITPAGVLTLLGVVTGPTNIITGLAFDPAGSGTLYAMQPSSGQLYRINLPALTTTPIGAALGGTLRALEFDATRNTLWGIDQSGGAARLVRLNATTGSRTIIGPLGTGIVNCGDLACDGTDGSLRTINATTGELLAIDPATGAATVLGPTGGVFGAAYGMASSAAAICRADFNGDDVLTVADIFAFLNAWFAGSPTTDFNSVGGLTVQDIFDFLAAWFVGC